jgi:thermostable 8-oxoguanine DNA glycosylase
MLAKHLDGIGPKQSRNLLQGIGVTKYEIPVDSRITKWLNQNLLKHHLSAIPLADKTYYDMVSDGIQLLCKKSNLYPCMLDAAIFTSFDGGWSESDIRILETLEKT